jgi:hypothetical protein
MLIKCDKCGYENFPQHRFCGMCGTELRVPGAAPVAAPRRVEAPPVPPPPLPAPREAVPQPVSGPSFLGLGKEAADNRSVSYLLEDEPVARPWGRYLLVMLLAGTVAAGWHWRQDLGGLARRLSDRVGGVAAPPNSAPAGSDKPEASDPATATQGQTPAPSAPAATAPPIAVDSAPPPQPDQSQSADQHQASDSASPAEVVKPDASAEPPRETAPAVVPSKVRAPATDVLETEGEKYLYGNGVRENCGRARKDLLAAAQHSNAKAQNVLGTMYATGHCATRDLPTAYRWFGRSLRQDPSNSRIEQDLKVLWNQMTPEERRLALRDER